MIVSDRSEQWILRKLYQANHTDIDTYRLFLTLRRYIYDTRDFHGIIERVTPSTIRFKPNTDIADDCFFSVSLFSGQIREKAKRRGAPGIRFYSNAGRGAFKSIGYPGISKDWKFWVSYVQEHFVV